jgi:DNA/RNA endonuclease YhcR with UshA esterase domain
MRLVPSLLVSGAILAALPFLACTKSESDKPAAGAPAAANAVQGTVLEVLPAAPYTYLRLKTAQGELWAAVPAADVKVGAAVTVLVQVKMNKFESKTLNRTFDSVSMGTLAGDAPAAAAAPAVDPAALAASVTAAHAAPPFPAMDKVAKATGPDAHTIAEIYAKKGALKDRTVTVKAKVMKVRSGILGKTWIHLSDGSGQAQSHDYDLTVTTKDAVQGGDVVTVKGVLHLDRDFGAGYVYPVILEDAKIVH